MEEMRITDYPCISNKKSILHTTQQLKVNTCWGYMTWSVSGWCEDTVPHCHKFCVSGSGLHHTRLNMVQTQTTGTRGHHPQSPVWGHWPPPLNTEAHSCPNDWQCSLLYHQPGWRTRAARLLFINCYSIKQAKRLKSLENKTDQMDDEHESWLGCWVWWLAEWLMRNLN